MPVVDVNESVRFVDNHENRALNRASVKLVQTPQCFQFELMQKAFGQPYNEGFTDCASVLESDGVKIALVEGNVENIKITRPQDLPLAEWFIENGI